MHGIPSTAVNCSILMPGLPVRERLRRAKAAGFDAVEFWWPFSSADPGEREVEDFAAEIEASEVKLIGMNLFAGDMGVGDRGVLSWPDRADELRASARIAAHLGSRLGVRRFNVLYGKRIPEADPHAQDAHAERMLREIAPLFDGVEGILMLEPVSGAVGYPLRTADDCARVIGRVKKDGGPDNVGILLDLYHLSTNGDDVAAAIEKHGEHAAHVQVADAPGRGAPSTGGLPLVDWVAQLRRAGYRGRIALEYSDASDAPLESDHLHAWKGRV